MMWNIIRVDIFYCGDILYVIISNEKTIILRIIEFIIILRVFCETFATVKSEIEKIVFCKYTTTSSNKFHADGFFFVNLCSRNGYSILPFMQIIRTLIMYLYGKWEI
jgi:hypothetical protein